MDTDILYCITLKKIFYDAIEVGHRAVLSFLIVENISNNIQVIMLVWDLINSFSC